MPIFLILALDIQKDKADTPNYKLKAKLRFLDKADRSQAEQNF